MNISINHLFNDRNNQMNNVVVVDTDESGSVVHHLFSYNSLICDLCEGKVARKTDFRSYTTSRHIKAFFKKYGIEMSTAQFYELERSE